MEESTAVVVRADGLPLAYRTMGEGPPVVCLAGGPGADARYLEDLAGLAGSFRLIVPDARGTGASPPPRDDRGYGFDRIADDLEALRAGLDLRPMSLLAHSAGCTTALFYAAAQPGMLERLVLVTPSRAVLYEELDDDTGAILRARSGEPWFAAAMTARDRLAAGPRPDELPALIADLAPAGYARWGERERAHADAARLANLEATRGFWRVPVDGPALRESLGMVAAPVLVITGALDTQVGVTAGRAWAACFPNGRHVTIDGAAHNPWVDTPGEFRDLVAELLAG